MDNYRDIYANPFYKSQAWINLSKNYKRKVGGICEECYKHGIITRGEIVHHIEHLNESNISDPDVALNEENLVLLCRKCHGKAHSERRWAVDSDGRLV